ncbi:hypothetical protein HGRIS_003017 [Hohenbuehelia grisea]|uniref:WD40 repeat-like protein n=1 Tax=Hohenbuehelia grisea TaxID=104357 RepID=A0ABR3JM73_9AGAR
MEETTSPIVLDPLARWTSTDLSKHKTIPISGKSVITALLLSQDRIIIASDDSCIHVFCAASGELLHSLYGHLGGVWCIAVSKDGRKLVSGSTDRVLRVWDLTTGASTHAFRGHTGTIRCLDIAEPVDGIDAALEHPLIVSASRDRTLRIWKLPLVGDQEYVDNLEEDDDFAAEKAASNNPYHLRRLEGHDHAIRSLSVHGRIAASGSYDTTVRVWDIVTGDCKWVFAGHTQKVYSIALDFPRAQVYSAGMDGTVRVWDLHDGSCKQILWGHASLVGLIDVSPRFLVSASADATLRTWDPETGKPLHTLEGYTGAITCFHHDDSVAVSGSSGSLKVWDLSTGKELNDLMPSATHIWQVAFDDRRCVAASSTQELLTCLTIWDLPSTSGSTHDALDSRKDQQVFLGSKL